MFDRVRKLIAAQSDTAIIDRYLAGAVDSYDLELRQREVDRGRFRQRPYRF